LKLVSTQTPHFLNLRSCSLLGRGGRSNHHAGNERFRELIRRNRPSYNDLPKHEKIQLSRSIVRAIEELGGRFLEPAKDGQSHYLVASRKRCVDKTSQCLREKRGDRGGAVTVSIKATAAAPRSTNTGNNNNNDADSSSSQQVGTTSKAA
jgi:hypothetical protein